MTEAGGDTKSAHEADSACPTTHSATPQPAHEAESACPTTHSASLQPARRLFCHPSNQFVMHKPRVDSGLLELAKDHLGYIVSFFTWIDILHSWRPLCRATCMTNELEFYPRSLAMVMDKQWVDAWRIKDFFLHTLQNIHRLTIQLSMFNSLQRDPSLFVQVIDLTLLININGYTHTDVINFCQWPRLHQLQRLDSNVSNFTHSVLYFLRKRKTICTCHGVQRAWKTTHVALQKLSLHNNIYPMHVMTPNENEWAYYDDIFRDIIQLGSKLHELVWTDHGRLPVAGIKWPRNQLTPQVIAACSNLQRASWRDTKQCNHAWKSFQKKNPIKGNEKKQLINNKLEHIRLSNAARGTIKILCIYTSLKSIALIFECAEHEYEVDYSDMVQTIILNSPKLEYLEIDIPNHEIVKNVIVKTLLQDQLYLTHADSRQNGLVLTFKVSTRLHIPHHIVYDQVDYLQPFFQKNDCSLRIIVMARIIWHNDWAYKQWVAAWKAKGVECIIIAAQNDECFSRLILSKNMQSSYIYY